MSLEPFREVTVGDVVVRWLLMPCLNPECSGRHRYGLVSADGGPWVVGLRPSDYDDVEEAEEYLSDDELRDVIVRQAVAFGVAEWDRVNVKEVLGQVRMVALLGSEAAGYLLDCPLDDLVGLRAIVHRRGAMPAALDLCGRFGTDEGGTDGGDG